jgi:hypothetical protein
MQRLTWSIIISLLLHVTVLSQINWKKLPASTGDQQRLTVSFAPYYSEHPANTLRKTKSSQAHADSDQFNKQTGEKGNVEMMTFTSAKIEISNAGEANEDTGHLDLNQVLNQAKEYAIKEYSTSIHAFTLNGDYYGTYTGSDNGTFFVHLDSGGHASGSGQSSMHSVSFNISGNVTKDGIVQMSGSGIAGNARFEGQLKISTGTISGSWSAGVIGSGTFSGQHE